MGSGLQGWPSLANTRRAIVARRSFPGFPRKITGRREHCLPRRFALTFLFRLEGGGGRRGASTVWPPRCRCALRKPTIRRPLASGDVSDNTFYRHSMRQRILAHSPSWDAGLRHPSHRQRGQDVLWDTVESSGRSGEEASGFLLKSSSASFSCSSMKGIAFSRIYLASAGEVLSSLVINAYVRGGWT